MRDHRPRHLLALFYPQDTTLEMGPTTVIPQSHYPALNREGAHTSEQHLSLPHPGGGAEVCPSCPPWPLGSAYAPYQCSWHTGTAAASRC